MTLDCDGLHEPLSHSLPVLLQNPALVTTRQVQDSKRVLEQALLHISIQLCVRVVTGRVVYLADRQFKALVAVVFAIHNVYRTVLWYKNGNNLIVNKQSIPFTIILEFIFKTIFLTKELNSEKALLWCTGFVEFEP